MWYNEIKKYNFKRPGFLSGTGEQLLQSICSSMFLSRAVQLFFLLSI